MSNIWLKLSCWVIGYNFNLVSQSTEHTRREVLKYMSALIIVSILWAFISYSFATKYVKIDGLLATVVALIMVIIVIQIERQIILGQNRKAFLFRAIIGLVMAFIGAVVMDQILFEEDVRNHISENIHEIVDDEFEYQSQEIISRRDTIYQNINRLYKEIQKIENEPDVIVYRDVDVITTKDTANAVLDKKIISTKREERNLKKDRIKFFDEQSIALDKEASELLIKLEDLRGTIRKNEESKTGFLREIKAQWSLLFDSENESNSRVFKNNTPVVLIWSAFFLFFLSLELLVVFVKGFDKDSDYQNLLDHQRKMKNSQLKSLSKP